MSEKETVKLIQTIFQPHNHDSFNDLSVKIFHHQFENNPVYHNFCRLTNKSPENVHSLIDIPFLPIQFFKSQRVCSSKTKEKLVFRSSGTTSENRSSHYIFNPDLYSKSIIEGFSYFYGTPTDYCFLVLSPSPQERPDSSLAFMANLLINKSHHEKSGFYLGRENQIPQLISEIKDHKVFLLGLSFALADLAEKSILNAETAIVMETGGMKGQRREMLREDLHDLIKKGMNTTHVHSEYSMCELFSQAYSFENGIFSCPPWMKVIPRDVNNALMLLKSRQIGGLNIIDLANIDTCSFIATQDIGRTFANGQFEVLGRLENSDLKGCSMMIE
jgi:hypothetical protein